MKGISAAPHTNTVFRDVLKRPPWSAFERLVEKHGADELVGPFTAKRQLLALLLGQLSGRNRCATSKRRWRAARRGFVTWAAFDASEPIGRERDAKRAARQSENEECLPPRSGGRRLLCFPPNERLRGWRRRMRRSAITQRIRWF
jgi:hypothetical protein